MQSAQVMHSICWPLRMSMPIGQTLTQAMQSMQSPGPVLTVTSSPALRSRGAMAPG